ncbi:hypothetical protein DFH94DRAFT_684106 [Russula ochroleuca]|uniref:Uncharacterized protein n=1 Tax=Russula ochroleuca TaxID=152965 RepID=A0A9P5K200_9AGAM|nr:hypothetical protein DFH94DRAFT_684106 [Russula ochroleuca]
MAASVDSILKYLPRLLPEIKVYPLPEDIFLSTIKALVVPAASLSLSQWGIVGSLILLTNISPTLRKATAKLYGYLSLIIGAEIALINAYVLVCSWISPSTTLQPLTVAILNVLNSLVPVYTDSLVLFYLVMEKASHSDSKINLVSSMGTPILLKFMRLAHAVMYIHTSTEFILTSFAIAKDGANPNTSIVDMARMWNVYISSSLQLVDNLYSLYMHWTHTITMWKSIDSSSMLTPTSIFGLIWSFGSQYILPIVLNAAQLAMSSYLPSSNTAMLIDSAKVVINIAGASVTTFRTKHLADLSASSALGKAEDLARNMVKVVPVPDDDVIGTTVSARTLTSMAASSGPAAESQTDNIPKVSTPQLNSEHHFSSPPGSS